MSSTDYSSFEDDNQCAKCLPSKCCTYFAFEIDEPVTRKDFEALLWQIAHENVTFYIHRKNWHIMIHNRCRFLTPQNQCGIYEQRPYICKEHSTEDCEYTGEDYGFTEHFRSYDELLIYVKENYNFRIKAKPTGISPNAL